MKSIFTILTVFILFQMNAQTIADFEGFNLNAGDFLNGQNAAGSFQNGNIIFPNNYHPAWEGFDGWAISATTDTQTPGSTNQFSAVSGGGYNGSSTYGVTFVLGESQMKLTGDAAGGVVSGLYVNNSTYAYLSMLEGDAIAKKFGGEDGNDPDFFLLTIKTYYNGTLSTDSIDFYLADYRFEENSMDYIVDEWTWIDLTSLDNVDSLRFTLFSSDVGTWGMNTPAYFCADNIETKDMSTATQNIIRDYDFEIFPNPTADFLTINWKENEAGTFSIYNLNGQILIENELNFGQNIADVQKLLSGMYLLKIQTKEGIATERFVKR